MTNSEQCCPGAGTMAHVRGCMNHPEYDGEVLGVLTGQVPVRSMPISRNNPIGPEEDRESTSE